VGLLSMRAVSSLRPSPVIRTSTLRRAGAGPFPRPAGRRMLPSSWASLPGGDGCFATSSIRQERRPASSSHQGLVAALAHAP
jgi:hypothetical protein